MEENSDFFPLFRAGDDTGANAGPSSGRAVGAGKISGPAAAVHSLVFNPASAVSLLPVRSEGTHRDPDSATANSRANSGFDWLHERRARFEGFFAGCNQLVTFFVWWNMHGSVRPFVLEHPMR